MINNKFIWLQFDKIFLLGSLSVSVETISHNFHHCTDAFITAALDPLNLANDQNVEGSINVKISLKLFSTLVLNANFKVWSFLSRRKHGHRVHSLLANQMLNNYLKMDFAFNTLLMTFQYASKATVFIRI